MTSICLGESTGEWFRVFISSQDYDINIRVLYRTISFINISSNGVNSLVFVSKFSFEFDSDHLVENYKVLNDFCGNGRVESGLLASRRMVCIFIIRHSVYTIYLIWDSIKKILFYIAKIALCVFILQLIRHIVKEKILQ